jgi:hypothetical protein
MECRNCGTEIADKAIVCYRCGQATTDPVRRAVPVRRKRTPLASVIGGAILMLLAAYAAYVSQTAADPDRWQTIAGVLAGAGVMVIILGLLRRR